jgi:hypothetical protein
MEVGQEGRCRSRPRARRAGGGGGEAEGAGTEEPGAAQGNEILRKASEYFAAAELVRRPKT